jgi:hypothetical protein
MEGIELLHYARHYSNVCLFLGLTVIGVTAQPMPAPAEDRNPQPTDFERLAEVLAPAGTPSIKGKGWVAVDTGPANHRSELQGWLIEDGAKEITILDWYGELHKLRKPAADEKRPTIKPEEDGGLLLGKIREADYSVAWMVRPEDFAAKSKKFLADGLPDDKQSDGVYGFVHQKYALESHIIDAARFAHFAHQLGQKALAAELYVHACEGQKVYQGRYIAEDKVASIHLFVANRIASGRRNGAIYAGHAGTSRKELQQRWETIAALPHHQYRDEAKEMAKHYQSLLEEDRRWVEPEAKTLVEMTTEQKVAYWLYHLRDLDVGQWSDPGRCYVLGKFAFGMAEDDKAKPNAAVELEKLGMAAVPQLIAHLDDASPTRCKGHWRSYWPDGHYLLRYGDCCQQIFESITGRTISSGDYPMQAGKGKECKANAERWWQDYQKKGEKQMLIEGTAVGDRDSSGHAKRLVEKYPDAALVPIIQGACASKDAWVRASLVLTADQLKDDKVAAFLKEELDGPFLDSRVRAAKALAAQSNPAGAMALLREWGELLANNVDRWEHGWAIDELVNALTRCGDPATLRRLGDDMPNHDVETRSTIIEQLAQVDKDLGNKPLTKETTEVIEDLLVQAMADMEQTRSYSSRANGKSVDEPTIGDLAAEALANRWKQPKLFDITGPLQMRERQRLELKNVWLQKRGQEPLPVPPPRQVMPAPESKVRPLVKAVLDAKTPADQKRAFEALEELGLPALPAVRKLLGTLEAGHPAITDVQSLAARLALIVGEARFATDSVKPSDALRRKLETLQGKPITEQAFMDLLRGTAGALPNGVRGIKITLERIPDDTGALLVVTLIADRPPRKGLSPQLTYGSRLRIDEKTLGGGISTLAGFGGREVGLAGIDWGDFTKNLLTALKAKPEQYLLVQAHCAQMR